MMDNKSDKHAVGQIDSRYRQLSLQLFGENRFKGFQGPFVDLSREWNRKSAVNLSKVGKNKVSSADRCLICYSPIGSLENGDLMGLKCLEELNEYLRILNEPVGLLNGNKVFSLAVEQLKVRTQKCFCVNCNAACGKLIELYRQLKNLEEEVKIYKAKFWNAIKLSKAIAEKEACENGSSNDVVDQLRSCLIGGTEKWEGIKNRWVGYVNFEDKIIENDLEAFEELNAVKIEREPDMNGLESEINFGDEDNDCISDDDDNQKKIINKVATQEQVGNFGGNVEKTGKQLAKPYTKRKLKPGQKLSMTPNAIRWRALRAKYEHLTNKQMKEHLKTLPRISRKGKPVPKLAIEDLKVSRSNNWHIKWRKTHGKTMSMTAYREMRRKEFLEKQKVNDDLIPGRSHIGPGGVKINWEEKGEGKWTYSGVEVRANEDGTFSCILCENNGIEVKRVKTRSRMSLHIKRIHFALTNAHACDKCDAKFFFHHQLTEHVRGKHVGLVCEICGISFPYPSSLFFHKRVKHQGIKPHVCEHCGKGFATKKDMTIHVRRHTGERPFVCHVCAKTFVEKQSMKKHIKKHHPGEPLEEPAKQDIRI